jgi:hypothetical protein
MHFHILKMYKDKEVKKNVKNIFLSICDVKVFYQLRDVNTICRRSWYIAAHVWKIYDFKIEVIPFIIHFSTELTETDYWTRAIKRFALFDLLKSLYSDTKILSKYIPSLQKRL